MAETDSIVSKEQTGPKQEPWDPLVFSYDRILTHLECIIEMFQLVLPVLKSKDELRDSRIHELTEELERKSEEIRLAESETVRREKIADVLGDANELLGHIQKIREAEHMFRQGIITSIVTKFDEFVTVILKIAYLSNPGWLKSSDRKLTYKELLAIESLDNLKSEIIDREVDYLMRDSHYAQMSFLDSKLKLGIQEYGDCWIDFLEITERRNLFVHTGGRVSPAYIENCKKWNIPLSDEIKEGQLLPAPDEYILHATDCFYEVIVRVFQAAARRLFPASFEVLDRKLNNETVELLTAERWGLAERIFESALKIPEHLRTSGEMEYYWLINLCIALKFGGKNYSNRLHSVNWSPFHPKYHFAVAVLEDRFDDADQLMRSAAVQAQITEKEFKEWPLLREFRNTDAFRESFKHIFNKDYVDQLLRDAKEQIKALQSNGTDQAGPATIGKASEGHSA